MEKQEEIFRELEKIFTKKTGVSTTRLRLKKWE